MRPVIVNDAITGRFFYSIGNEITYWIKIQRKRGRKSMNRLQRMKLLEDRLNRLERNPRDNYGVRQKIKREIESIRKENNE